MKFLDVHTNRKINYSVIYTMYANASHDTPSYTQLCTVHGMKSPSPWTKTCEKIDVHNTVEHVET